MGVLIAGLVGLGVAAACAGEGLEAADPPDDTASLEGPLSATAIEPSTAARKLELPRCATSSSNCEGEFANEVDLDEVRGDAESLYVSVRRKARARATREAPKVFVSANGGAPVQPTISGNVASDGKGAWVRIPVLGFPDGKLDVTVRTSEGERNFSLEKSGNSWRWLDAIAGTMDFSRAFDVSIEVSK